MKTLMAKPAEVERKWYIVDATDMPLGRLASQVADILHGKNKVDYTPIYMLDNGESAENRFELVDMKSTAMGYTTGGDTQKITRETYDKLVEGLNRLNELGK